MAREIWQQNPDYEGAGMRGTSPAVFWLLALNIGVYFLQVTFLGEKFVYEYLALFANNFPSDRLSWLNLFTHMFVHAGIGHLAFNMITLWMFGTRVERAWNTKSFIIFYLWCGLGGALLHILVERSGILVGASGAITGVLLAYAIRWPNEMVYFFGFIPVRSKWLPLVMIAVNLGFGLWYIKDGGGGIGWFAHLGGLLFGWIYLKLFTRRGYRGALD